jgi:hypothetical protein
LLSGAPHQFFAQHFALLKKTSASIRKTGGCRKQAAIVFFSLFSDLMRLGDLTHEPCDLMTFLNRVF